MAKLNRSHLAQVGSRASRLHGLWRAFNCKKGTAAKIGGKQDQPRSGSSREEDDFKETGSGAAQQGDSESEPNEQVFDEDRSQGDTDESHDEVNDIEDVGRAEGEAERQTEGGCCENYHESEAEGRSKGRRHNDYEKNSEG
jgi:hypothetical protein